MYKLNSEVCGEKRSIGVWETIYNDINNEDSYFENFFIENIEGLKKYFINNYKH